MEGCEAQYLYMCWIKPGSGNVGIFGFAVFVQAFALLILIYMVSEVSYQFRISSAPISLWLWTFILCGFIGIGTLATDAWFSGQWLLPDFLGSQVLWQTFFGLLFLIIVLSWLWFAFIWPPKFGRSNYIKYARTLFRYILRGSEAELPVVAAELRRSAKSIVKFAQRYKKSEDKSGNISVGQTAYDIILLIGNRRFCRYLVSSSPATAIEFLNAMFNSKNYKLPISQFLLNISVESIKNKDSILYHENNGYYSGLLGYLKPFSTALYGDFELVEALTVTNSPLDIDFRSRASWDA